MAVTVAWDYPNNNYCNATQEDNNAICFAAYCRTRGWTDEAIAGTLGNIDPESTINPSLWEGRVEPYSVNAQGFGLIQWTGYNRLTKWAHDQGLSAYDPYVQIRRIEADGNNIGDVYWFRPNYAPSTVPYNVTWSEYINNSRNWTPAELAIIFYWYRERSAAHDPGQRPALATHYYNIIIAHPDERGTPQFPSYPDPMGPPAGAGAILIPIIRRRRRFYG